MPEGVEHNLVPVIQAGYRLAFPSLMPEGVEHDPEFTVYIGPYRVSFADAGRR